MSYVYVTSDGEGFQISTSQSNVAPTIGNLISFAIDHYLSHTKVYQRDDNILEQLGTLTRCINHYASLPTACNKMCAPINSGTYYHDATQMIIPQSEYDTLIYNALTIAFKLITTYPDEFAQYLTRLCSQPFSEVSSYGASIFNYSKHHHGLGSYIRGGVMNLTLTDNKGNDVNLVPKVLRTTATDVVPNIDSVDFTFMNNTVKSVTVDIRSRIKSLKSSLATISKTEYTRGYNAGVSVLTNMPNDWTVGTLPGKLDKYFIWQGRTNVTTINDHNTLYKLPGDISRHIYLTDIAVPIGEKLGNVMGKGWHPHLNSDESINRPSTSWHSLCIGDLNGQPLSRMSEIVKQMEIVYVGSMFSSSGSDVVRKLIGDDTYDVVDDCIRTSSGNRLKVGDPLFDIYKYAGRLGADEGNVGIVWSV